MMNKFTYDIMLQTVHSTVFTGRFDWVDTCLRRRTFQGRSPDYPCCTIMCLSSPHTTLKSIACELKNCIVNFLSLPLPLSLSSSLYVYMCSQWLWFMHMYLCRLCVLPLSPEAREECTAPAILRSTIFPWAKIGYWSWRQADTQQAPGVLMCLFPH